MLFDKVKRNFWLYVTVYVISGRCEMYFNFWGQPHLLGLIYVLLSRKSIIAIVWNRK